jgi:hypothetical protein
MNEPESNANKLNLKVDYRIITVALLLVIVLMLAIWKPWSPSPTAKDRTISVSGDATVKAAPDEFLFSPSYQFTNGDKDAALKAISAKSNEVVAGLKKLGVPESGIKNNADSWNYPTYRNGRRCKTGTKSRRLPTNHRPHGQPDAAAYFQHRQAKGAAVQGP